MSTSIALGSHFEEFIRRQLESGRYKEAAGMRRPASELRSSAERERLRED